MGFRVLIEALSRGYSVRAIVRKVEQAELIKRPDSIRPYLARLEVVVVPDLLVEGAFDGILDRASGVVHVASPLAIPVSLSIFRMYFSLLNTEARMDLLRAKTSNVTS